MRVRVSKWDWIAALDPQPLPCLFSCFGDVTGGFCIPVAERQLQRLTSKVPTANLNQLTAGPPYIPSALLCEPPIFSLYKAGLISGTCRFKMILKSCLILWFFGNLQIALIYTFYMQSFVTPHFLRFMMKMKELETKLKQMGFFSNCGNIKKLVRFRSNFKKKTFNQIKRLGNLLFIQLLSLLSVKIYQPSSQLL